MLSQVNTVQRLAIIGLLSVSAAMVIYERKRYLALPFVIDCCIIDFSDFILVDSD